MTSIAPGAGPEVDVAGEFAGGGRLGEVMASWNWSATPVGALPAWPPALRQVVSMMLASRFPMWVGWGPQFAFFYNEAYQRDTLQAKHPWALGRPAAEVWAEIWDDIGPRISSVVQTGQATWDEGLLLFLERAGYVEETYHTFSYSPLRGDDNTIAGFLCVVSEDTERVLGERRLRILSELGHSAAATGLTVDAACTAAIDVLRRHRIDVPFASIYLLEESGATASRAGFYGTVDDPLVVPGTISRDTHPDVPLWRTLPVPQVIEELQTGFTGLFEPLPEPMHGRFPDAAIAVPLTGGGGEPVGVLFAGISPFRAFDDDYRRFVELVARQVGTSITTARAYQAQQQRAEELAELDRAKTEFFAGVSHELRTPLTLIAGPAEDALADVTAPLPPAQRARMEVIARNGGRLRRLVDTLLEFVRLEAGRLVPDRVAVDLAELTRGIAESFAPAIERAGLEHGIDCTALPSAVSVDVDMWEKIVLNLLSNALKFTLSGSVHLTLAPAADGGVELTVRDTGVGIAADEQQQIFERFHRVRGTTGRSHEGTGIGLALVAELAGLHGGTVHVTSTVGRGSAFSVALPASALTGAAPVAAAASATVGLYRDEALQWSPQSDGRPIPEPAVRDSGAARVLVAEDNQDLRNFLVHLLGRQYAVLTATDGDAALELVRTDRPDLILTDVMMPGLDGFGFIAALRADPATSTIPVIMLSARAGEEAAIEGLAAGADDYLVKPFSSHDLLARVRSNLDMARLRNHTARRDRLLAEVGDLLAASSDLAERLDGVARSVAAALGDLVVIALREPDGRMRTAAAAHPARPELAATVLQSPPHHVPEMLLPDGFDTRPGMTVPLTMSGRLLGSIMVVDTGRRKAHDPFDLQTVQELGRRLAGAVEADRFAQREHHLHTVTAALAAAATVAEVSRVLAASMDTVLGASGVAVYTVHPDDPDHLHLVHALGYPAAVATAFATVATAADLPAAHAAQSRQALWMADRTTWSGRYPHMAVPGAADEAEAVATVPLLVGTRVVGVLALSFPTARLFPPDERGFTTTLAGQAALALDRAALSDVRWEIAQTLQLGLLPARLPTLDRVALAARYLPAGRDTDAGGDWYDVTVLDPDRIAIAVGDVVGQGTGAAAVMGQLRSALSAYLLENHSPARALELLSRFAGQIDGARGSTAICLVLDTATGHVHWARAGHLPPLVLAPDGTTRYLDDTQGAILGLTGAAPITEGDAVLTPGSAVLLFTDGLVERRGEVVDEGLDRLATALSDHARTPVEQVLPAVLAAALDGSGPRDDVAAVMARLRPAALVGARPAVPAQLSAVRREVDAWAALSALPGDMIDDLQLALGEALANSVEHAYAGGSGQMRYRLEQRADGGLDVTTEDGGTWRPPPADPGYRGHGLRTIRALTVDLAVTHDDGGTVLRFGVPPRPPSAAPPGPVTTPGPAPADARLRLHRDADRLRLHLSGDLDLATVPGLRAALLSAVAGASVPVEIDVRDVAYLSSIGVALLLDARRTAARPLRLLAADGSATVAILRLAGLLP